jgi:LacI family transcriptional regulator
MSRGYTVIFCNTDRRPEKEAMAIDLLTDKRVDGIIFTGGGLDGEGHVAERLRADANVVTIGPHRLPFPSIGVDDRAAIASGVRHLAEQGCSRIACIGGQPGWLIHEERIEGFKRGLEAAGLPFDPALVWLTDLSADAGRAAVEGALHDGLEFDAVIAFSDYAALGAMRALRQAGIRIPADVAVVGCDDIPLTTLVEPELTSVAFPLHEFGAEAARMLIEMSERRPVQQHKEFSFELHVRESSMRTGT